MHILKNAILNQFDFLRHLILICIENYLANFNKVMLFLFFRLKELIVAMNLALHGFLLHGEFHFIYLLT